MSEEQEIEKLKEQIIGLKETLYKEINGIGGRIRKTEDKAMLLDNTYDLFIKNHSKQEKIIEKYMNKTDDKLEKFSLRIEKKSGELSNKIDENKSKISRMFWIGVTIISMISFVKLDGIKALIGS